MKLSQTLTEASSQSRSSPAQNDSFTSSTQSAQSSPDAPGSTPLSSPPSATSLKRKAPSSEAGAIDERKPKKTKVCNRLHIMPPEANRVFCRRTVATFDLSDLSSGRPSYPVMMTMMMIRRSASQRPKKPRYVPAFISCPEKLKLSSAGGRWRLSAFETTFCSKDHRVR